MTAANSLYTQHGTEIVTIYDEPQDRWVAAFVISFPHNDPYWNVTNPTDAIETARDFLNGPTQHGTIWSIHDRKTGHTQTHSQGRV